VRLQRFRNQSATLINILTLQNNITNFDSQPVVHKLSNEKEKGKIFIYATTATSRPAKTPMATPLTLFLSAALDPVGVGVLVEDSLVEDWLDEGTIDEDREKLLDDDSDKLDEELDEDDSGVEEVDTTVLVLKNINIRSKETTTMRLTLC
jgi:hypothetical protein